MLYTLHIYLTSHKPQPYPVNSNYTLQQGWATFLPPGVEKELWELWFLSQAAPTTLAKVHIIFIHINFFLLGAWWAAQELLRPVGRRLPTPALQLKGMKGKTQV